jgi:hemoglobin-like flavoprotein
MIKADPEARYGSLDEALGGLHRDDAVEVVRESYRRLVKSKGGGQSDFFRSFYVKFLEQYPGIEDFFNPKEKFGKLTSDGPVSQGWQRQFQVLKEAVLLLIVFHAFNESQQEPNILTRILDAHTDRKIPGGLYAAFGEVLIDSVIDKDVDAHMPKSELRRAWEQVIKDGLDYMENKTLEKERAKYAKPPPIIMKV